MMEQELGNRTAMQDFYRDNGKCCVTRAYKYAIIMPVDVK